MADEIEKNNDVKIKVIRIGESEIPFENFDAPVSPLTKEQELAISLSAKKALKEMLDFESKANE